MENNSYKEIWDEIKKHDSITICSHIKPDGDTIAVALALKELIKINIGSPVVKISGDSYPQYLSFLPKPDEVDDKFFESSLKIIVDTSTKSRIWDKRVVTEESIKIDHHHHEGKWLLQVGGDHWPACGEVIYEMIKELKLKSNKLIEEMLFISIWTDTEGMTQRNISKQTHEAINSFDIDKDSFIQKFKPSGEVLKQIEAAPLEKNGIVTTSIINNAINNDIYRQYVTGVFERMDTEVLLVGTELKESFRFGLRSRGNVDISKYAKKMGGGGHFASSGFNLEKNNEVLEKIEELVKEINEKK